MRFFWILLCALSFSSTFSESSTSLGTFKDRLVAVVEKTPITEKELIKRFELYQKIYPRYANKTYAEARESLLEEICMDRVHDLLWASLTQNRSVDISTEQLAAFRSRYSDLECDNDTLKSVYSSWIKRDNLARHMVHDKITITQQDLAAATRQPMLWEAVEGFWSFDLAYSDQPLSDAKAAILAKNLKNYPIARLSPALLQSIDWSQMHTWQFFQNEGEYVAVRINKIQLANLLPYIYDINLIPAHKGVNELPVALRLTAPHEASPELWALLDPLSPGEISQDTIVLHGKTYHIELLCNTESPDLALIESRLIEALKNHRAQEKLPSWYAELKNNYFIKVFPT